MSRLWIAKSSIMTCNLEGRLLLFSLLLTVTKLAEATVEIDWKQLYSLFVAA